MSLVIIGIWGLLALYGLKKHNAKSINILIVMAIMQNIILILCSEQLTQISYKLFILIKELYVVGLICIGYVKKRKMNQFEFECMICIVLILVFALVYGTSSLSGTLVSVRQLYLPFLFFLLGSVSFTSAEDLEKSIRFFVIIMLISAIFGWVEMILGDEFWIRMGYASYAKLKSIESGLTSDTGVYGAFYSYDLGIRMRRMASFLADPVILGQLVAFALIVAIFMNGLFKSKMRKYISTVILALALLSTIAKGGIIIALFTFSFVLGKIWRERGLSVLFKVLFIVILIIGISYTFLIGANGITHIEGLTENLRNLPQYPFGRGIGSIGNLGYNYGGRGTLLANGESFFGAAIGQMGIVAIMIYTWFYSKLFKLLAKSSKKELYGIGNIILWLNIGLFITAFVNNTAISFTSCFIYYVMAGGVYKAYRIQCK